LLLSSVYTASRLFLLLTLLLPASGLAVHEKLGGDTAGTAGPSLARGHPTPGDVVLSKNSWEGGSLPGLLLLKGLAGRWLAGGEQLFFLHYSFHSFVFGFCLLSCYYLKP